MHNGDESVDFDPEHPTEFVIHYATTVEVESLVSENAGDHPIYWSLVVRYRSSVVL